MLAVEARIRLLVWLVQRRRTKRQISVLNEAFPGPGWRNRCRRKMPSEEREWGDEGAVTGTGHSWLRTAPLLSGYPRQHDHGGRTTSVNSAQYAQGTPTCSRHDHSRCRAPDTLPRAVSVVAPLAALHCTRCEPCRTMLGMTLQLASRLLRGRCVTWRFGSGRFLGGVLSLDCGQTLRPEPIGGCTSMRTRGGSTHILACCPTKM